MRASIRYMIRRVTPNLYNVSAHLVPGKYVLWESEFAEKNKKSWYHRSVVGIAKYIVGATAVKHVKKRDPVQSLLASADEAPDVKDRLFKDIYGAINESTLKLSGILYRLKLLLDVKVFKEQFRYILYSLNNLFMLGGLVEEDATKRVSTKLGLRQTSVELTSSPDGVPGRIMTVVLPFKRNYVRSPVTVFARFDIFADRIVPWLGYGAPNTPLWGAMWEKELDAMPCNDNSCRWETRRWVINSAHAEYIDSLRNLGKPVIISDDVVALPLRNGEYEILSLIQREYVPLDADNDYIVTEIEDKHYLSRYIGEPRVTVSRYLTEAVALASWRTERKDVEKLVSTYVRTTYSKHHVTRFELVRS